MEKIKVTDAAAEMGIEPSELVARLGKLGVKKTAKGSISPEEFENVKKSEASVEVVRKDVNKDVIVRRRSKPAAAPAAVEPAAEEKPASPEVAEVKAAPVEAKAAPAAEKAPKAAKPAEEAKAEKPRRARVVEPKATPAARIVTPKAEAPKAAVVVEAPKAEAPAEVKPEVKAEAPKAAKPVEEAKAEAPRRARVVEPKAAPAARIVTPKAEAPKAAVVVEAPKAAPAAKVVAAPEAKAVVKAEAPKAERASRGAAFTAEPEGSSQPSLLPPVQERRREEKAEAPKAAAPADGGAPRVRVISRPDPTQARIVRPAAPGEGRPSRDGEGRGGHERGGRDDRGDRGGRDMRGPRGPRPTDGREGDSRDRDSARGPRGPRPGGPRPGGPRPGGFSAGAPFAAQPPMENEQSRKKRNTKSRHSNDFPRENEDFSRSRHAAPDLHDMMDEDGGMVRRRSHKPKKQHHQAPAASTAPMKAAKRKLRVEESIRVADMAHQMGVKSSEIIKILFGLGVMATINNALDIDTATLVAAEFGYEVEKVGFSEEDILTSVAAVDTPEMLKGRPPVVTIMGHVDHGKTSLLDAIRKTSVTSGEAGGITQHIGAYHVKTKRGDIVFLDTPGHAAFTAMRARGAQLTDLVVLVVAADDGVMDQTREAINHSRAAGVPIMVAVNKIDKETANPDRVLRELAELGLQAEDWGGDTIVGMVSAKTGKGLDDLLELIALQAEVLELKANPDKPARGHVVEAKLDKGRGPVATVLVQEGTLRQGDIFVCGVFSGRVRAMFNDQGRKIKEAGPSMPVEIQGFDGVPEAGEEFVVLADEKTARRIAESRAAKLREKELAKSSRVTLENFLSQRADAKETLVLNVVLKADVQGSLEAITEYLRNKISTEKVRIEIIHGGAGAISESDIMLAAASNAIIIGFNVRPTAKVKEVAEQEQVDIRFYDIIYKLGEEIKAAMAGMLAPVSKEVYLGQAEVRDTFSVPKVGVIAGCMVTDGKLTRNALARLLRDGVVVYTGKISSLKRHKDDAREVVRNLECGVGLENFHDIKIGDVIEAFEMVEEAASLD